jgi:LPS export ABC transporter protein LptC
MLKRERHWLLILMVLAIISSALWYQWCLQNPTKSKTNGDYVDTIAERLTLKRFDDQGRLIQVLESPRATHYALSKETYFDRPSVLVYPTEAGHSVWQMQAGKGVLTGNKDRLDLSVNVDMHEMQANPKRLQTSQLSWYLQTKVAVTDQWLVGTEPGVRVTSIGARFEQSKGVIYLLKQVNAVYQPR